VKAMMMDHAETLVGRTSMNNGMRSARPTPISIRMTPPAPERILASILKPACASILTGIVTLILRSQT
jgi:hypothetical protein